jgi:nitrite reductase (NADH) small subunit
MPGYVKVATTNEVTPGQAKMVEVEGKKIALFNVDGSFYAIDDTCTIVVGRFQKGSLRVSR